jgi:propanediol dehydratase small subunit
MPRWDANAEVEQAYYFREQAGVARTIGEDELADLFDQVARLAIAKAEIFQSFNKLHEYLEGHASEVDALHNKTPKHR